MDERPRKRAKRLSLGNALKENDDAAEKQETRKATREDPEASGRKRVLPAATGQPQTKALPANTQDINTVMELYSKNVVHKRTVTHNSRKSIKRTLGPSTSSITLEI